MAQQSTPGGRAALYAGTGLTLTQYDIDVEAATLTQRGSLTLPASTQYAWQHASKRYLYLAASDSGSGAVRGAPGNTHCVCAFLVDQATGALTPHGDPVPLRQRPIHLTTDAASEYLLIAYNLPSTLTVHRINGDGTIGEEIPQAPFDGGIFAHQVRMLPSGRGVVLVTRGNDATRDKREDPGALKVFKYRDGKLSDEVSIAPNGGYGFGPRHLDFHPNRRWVYVSLERQDQIQLFTLQDDAFSPQAVFSKPTLADPATKRPRQLAGTVHVHPNGRVVYGCERATHSPHGQVEDEYQGGENTIVAYAIDERTGEPYFLQRVETKGMHPRTFSIDPSGRLLIVGNKSPVVTKTGGPERHIPASLDVFRIAADGKLDYVRKYDVDVCNACMFWSGLITL
jgi:6-phosphogluconolactonase (cycloisomerase 2 family)